MMKTELVLIGATLIASATHAQTPTNLSAPAQAAAAVQPQSIEITENSVFRVHLEAAR